MSLSPSLSIIIPVRPGEYPGRVVAKIRESNFPEKDMEVLIVEGFNPSQQRNKAAEHAKGEILYFLDDDSFVGPDTIRQGISLFDDKHVAAVGGPAVTYADGSMLEQLFGAVVGALFGGFITRARNIPLGQLREVRGEELILCNLMFRKEKFLSNAGFKEDLYPNEENELIKRLRIAGEKFLYNPQMIVHRSRRTTLSAFAQQSFAYGAGRAHHIFRAWSWRDLPFFLPSAFLLYLVFACCFFQPELLYPLALYGMLISANSLAIAQERRSLRFGLCLPLLFYVLHVSYGCGFLWAAIGDRIAVAIRILQLPAFLNRRASS